MMNIPKQLEPHMKNLDLKNKTDRLLFFKRWTGAGQGNDPNYMYTVQITPEIAGWILSTDELCIINRSHRIHNKRIQTVVREMQAGNWVNNAGAPFVYDEEGRFANGYGRCNAVIASGHSFGFLISGPWTAAQIGAMDLGYSRTPVDRLNIHHGLTVERQPKLFKDVMTVLRHHICGGVQPPVNTTNELFGLSERFIEDYLELHKTIDRKRVFTAFRQPEVLAAFIYARHSVYQPHVDVLWGKIVENNGLVPETIAHTLHREITARPAKQAQDKLNKMHRLLHGISASIHYRHLKRLAIQPGSDFDDAIWDAQYRKEAAR